MLNTFNVYNYILETNNNTVSSVTIAIFSTFVKHDYFISYCNAYYLLYYTAILRYYFVC